MRTLFVLKNSEVIVNGGYKRIVFLDLEGFDKLEKSADDEEGFISTLHVGQLWVDVAAS
jgi:hypothetical protein